MSGRTDALIEQLSAIHPKGFDLSLDRITGLLEKLGNPHLQIPPAIHVAGTNGKGSTLAFIRAILEAGGYKVHVHTSPHLVNWNERYRLAGKLVDDDTLANTIERVASANDGKPITIFEIMSAVMFVLFSEHRADFSLVEVGLGGRFDATNVLQNPVVTAITPVALDHQAYLGDTIAKIAFEKAGIIKRGSPVAVGIQQDEALEVIREVAEKNASRLSIARQDFDFDREATGFVFQDTDGLLDLPSPRLSGEHQLANAALAIATIRLSEIEIADSAFEKAMETVTWPGRLERLAKGRITAQFHDNADIWIDGGHNPNAGEAIAEELAKQIQLSNTKLLMICGMINTKEPVGYFTPFAELDTEVLTVPISMSDAGIPPDELANHAIKAGLKASPFGSIDEAVSYAQELRQAEKNIRVLFSGSLYMIGEILERNGTPPQ